MALYRGSSRETTDCLLLARETLRRACGRGEEIIQDSRRNAAARIKETRKKARKWSLAEAKRNLSEEKCAQQYSLELERRKMLQDSERDALSLALHIAEQILRREVSQSAESLAREVAHVVESLLETRGIKVRVHPDDHAEVSLFLRGTNLPTVTVDHDDLLAQGTALVETFSGTVEIDWQKSFTKISEDAKCLLEEQLR